MPAFSYSRRDQFVRVIHRLSSRLFNAVSNDVTPDDILQAFVQPEHHQTCRDVVQLFGYGGDHVTFSCRITIPEGAGLLGVGIHYGDPKERYMLPNYVSQGWRGVAPAEIVAKLEKFARRRIELSREAGLARDVFTELADRCASPKAVAFFLPSVAGLAQLIEDDDKPALEGLRDRLTQAGMPPLPHIDARLRNSVAPAEQFFARAMLLNKKSETKDTRPVDFELSDINKVRTPWGTIGSAP